jgi:hypothetical protein
MTGQAPTTWDSTPGDERIYIHEIIRINKANRANYVHHMTANWSPTAQEDRDQLCYGVWPVVGSTGGWPEVVNIWEMRGWKGLADGFSLETVGQGAQDPKLERWWQHAADFRHGGIDRILEPAPWTRGITQLMAEGAGGACYAHEIVKVRPGTAVELLERVREGGMPLAAAHGWDLVGAWRTTMVNDDEAILLWAVPSWDAWAAFEREQATGEIQGWRRSLDDVVTSWQRWALVDAPLCPFRTGRQPHRDDRTDWVD